MPRRLLLILTLAALCMFAGRAAPQTESPNKIPVESHLLQAPIHAESDLVLVPVFVFDKQRMSYVSFEQRQCDQNQRDIFFSLPPSQPCTQPDCIQAEIPDLTGKDFRLLQDGVEQRILRVAREGWWIAVRDNMTYHLEHCLTPAGIWSSRDQAREWSGVAERRYYSLAYVPANSDSGCHSLKVEVDRRGTMIFTRDQYCTGQTPSDPLYGTKYDAQLQSVLTSGRKRGIRLSLQAGYFYTDTGEPRVQVALEFPWKDLEGEWDESTGTLHVSIGVLGMFYAKDGTARARFSDLLYPSYWPTFAPGGYNPAAHAPTQVWMTGIDSRVPTLNNPAWVPTRYERQAKLPEGEYQIRVALSDGEKFGRAELPLRIDHRDETGVSLSSVMLCKRFRDAHVAAVERAAANFAPQYVPLVSKGIEFTPVGDTSFTKGERLIPYFEVYKPLLASQPGTTVQVHLRVVDAETGKMAKDFPPVDAGGYEQAGSSTITVAREIPFGQFPKGAYRLEVQATDSAGRSTPWRTANFTVE